MPDIPRIGSQIWEGNYTVKNCPNLRYGKGLKYFEYNWKTPENEKIVIWSDLGIPSAQNPKFSKVPYKVAWMMEGPGVYEWGHFQPTKKWLFSNLDVFAAVATCDDSLVDKYPDKMIFVPYGGILVPLESTRIYEKTKLCSMTMGTIYPPRDVVYSKYKDSGKVDFLGKAVNKPYASTEDGFKDYMYHITIASSCQNRYFSQNLTDAFACGTVPIWWGCPGIGDFFDINGMIIVNSLVELDEALKKISPEDYNNRLSAVATNHQLVEKYRTPENVLWENVLSKLY
ncbi:MAG: hypothetical protein QQN41_04855 [Nitrosopumilus sp.]